MSNWIIVVDDDADSLALTERILSRAGFRVTALRSGALALNFMREIGVPDLVLMDVTLPEPDGFRTLELLRQNTENGRDVPVALLSVDHGSDLEVRGLEAGAVDFIRKPFNPEVLISRIRNILNMQTQLSRIARTAETDPLTGCLNKPAAEALMTRYCLQETGFLCMLDLDNFKSVNDIYGHDAGDRMLVMFSRVIARHLSTPADFGRIGGDEFVLFLHNQRRSDDLIRFTRALNEDYLVGAKQVLGDQPSFSLGVSVGAVSVPKYGSSYPELFHLADQALQTVKRNGRHACRLYSSAMARTRSVGEEVDLETVTAILEERVEAPSAMWIGQDVFGSIYKYIVRYITRYHNCAYRVLMTIRPLPDLDALRRAEIIASFKSLIRLSLRNSDVMMECGHNQIFLLLPEVNEQNIERVINRLMRKYKSSPLASQSLVLTEHAPVHTPGRNEDDSSPDQSRWAVVVDQDPASLALSGRALSGQSLRVTLLPSLPELPEVIRESMPDLILLNLNQPGPEGIEYFREMKTMFSGHVPPVIILCAPAEGGAESLADTETECLRMGAIDFIRKPFAPEALGLRAVHVLRVAHLQRYLTEVLAQ